GATTAGRPARRRTWTACAFGPTSATPSGSRVERPPPWVLCCGGSTARARDPPGWRPRPAASSSGARFERARGARLDGPLLLARRRLLRLRFVRALLRRCQAQLCPRRGPGCRHVLADPL